jgi:hypothetical protein
VELHRAAYRRIASTGTNLVARGPLTDTEQLAHLAADIEPYLSADGTKVWSLMQLERRLHPEAHRRRRGGCLDRRRTPAADTEQLDDAGDRREAFP